MLGSLGVLALSVADCRVVGTLKQPGEEAHMGRSLFTLGQWPPSQEYFLASLEPRFIFL